MKKKKNTILQLIRRQCSSCDNVWFIDFKKQQFANLELFTSTMNRLDSIGEGSLSRAAAQNASLNAAAKQKSLKTCPQCAASQYEESDFFIDTNDKETLKILSGTKKCPVCAELIKAEAKKCKHCDHTYSEEDITSIQEAVAKVNARSHELEREITEQKKVDRKNTKIGCLTLAGAFFLLLLLVGMCNSEGEDKVAFNPWYSGGTLHGAKVSEWKQASYENKLATAADWLAATSWEEYLKDNPGSVNSQNFKEKAEYFVRGIEEATSGLDKDDATEVSQLAALLSTLSNDLGP